MPASVGGWLSVNRQALAVGAGFNRNVRFGSKAVIPIGLTYDRFAP
jgi:hypothetical protein